MDFIFEYLFVLHFIIAALVIYKTVLFFKTGKKYNLSQWVYFNQYSVYNSHDIDSRKSKTQAKINCR